MLALLLNDTQDSTTNALKEEGSECKEAIENVMGGRARLELIQSNFTLSRFRKTS